MPNPPSQVFFPDAQAESLASITATAAGGSQEAMVARVNLIDIARGGNEEARAAIINLSKVVPPNKDFEKKRKFKKPRRLTKDYNRQDRLKLRREESAVRTVDGRILNIEDVLQKGGIAGTKKIPQYITDAIEYKMSKARAKASPSTLGMNPVTPKPPSQKQLQRQQAIAQASEDSM